MTKNPMKIWWTKIFFNENKSFNIESDVAFGIIKIEAKAFENSNHEVAYTFTLGFYFFKYPKKKHCYITARKLCIGHNSDISVCLTFSLWYRTSFFCERQLVLSYGGKGGTEPRRERVKKEMNCCVLHSTIQIFLFSLNLIAETRVY